MLYLDFLRDLIIFLTIHTIKPKIEITKTVRHRYRGQYFFFMI